MFFFLKVLAWLPLTFSIWYYFSILFTWPIALAVDGSLPNLFFPVIAEIRQNGYQLTIVGRMFSSSGSVGLVKFDVNTLLYSNCLPLYTALVLASPGGEGQKWVRWLIGLALLWIVATLGVSLEILKYFLTEIPGALEILNLPSWAVNGLVLSDLYGNLLLPALAPLVIWIALNLDYIRQLAPGLGKTASL
jgi:hypothetical protein